MVGLRSKWCPISATLRIFSVEKKELPAKCMETLHPEASQHTMFVPEGHLTHRNHAAEHRTYPDVYRSAVYRQPSLSGCRCTFMRHSDSLQCSKPTEFKSRRLNQIFIFYVINVIFQKILTNVCLLLPPSSLRLHLSLIPSPAFVFRPCFGTCLNFLSTSDLQMNCMLRSSSTKPLVRSWTMPSTT